MAISTYGITLKCGTSPSALTKLVDIKDFPDLGGAPELLETTTLSDAAQTFINGIQTMSAMEFTANYTDSDFDAVMAKAGTRCPARWSTGTAASIDPFRIYRCSSTATPPATTRSSTSAGRGPKAPSSTWRGRM